MKIGLLVIGNELLEGKILDANTQCFAKFLAERNLELSYSLTIGDSEDDIKQSLEFLYTNCQIVLTSGGLGPTKDDITKMSLGKFFKKDVKFSQEAFKISKENYLRFNKNFEDKNHGYCFLPEDFLVLSNTTGLAPCYAYKTEKILLAAPGVPREFNSFLTDHFDVLTNDFLDKKYFFENLNYKTSKIPEEKIFTEIDSNLWNALSELGTVSSLPNLMGVDIGIRLKADSLEELNQKKISIQNIIDHSPVKEIIWQRGHLQLEEWIVKLCNEKNITYGFAESATGGLCSQRITSVSGSSQTFIGSIICYSEAVKERSLNVNRKTIDEFGVVSEEVAREMANGLSKNLNVDIAISITGYAGPTGGDAKNPVGTACFAVCTKGQTKSYTFHYHGDRNLRRLRFSQECLFLLLAELESFA